MSTNLAEERAHALPIIREQLAAATAASKCQVCGCRQKTAEAFPGEGEALDLCPTDEPAERRGWPPLPGDYHVLRYRAAGELAAAEPSESTGAPCGCGSACSTEGAT